MQINEIEIQSPTEFVAVYPGRFHPFHRGHKSVYDALVQRFGSRNVFIATSDKVEIPRSPFTFEDKKAMMILAGIPSNAIVKTSSPYRPAEIINRFDPETTVLVLGIGEDDMADSPRFTFEPKQDGSPSYFQPFPEGEQVDVRPLNIAGYILTLPTVPFNVMGQPSTHATEMRQQFASLDNAETEQQFIRDLFGNYSDRVHEIMKNKL